MRRNERGKEPICDPVKSRCVRLQGRKLWLYSIATTAASTAAIYLVP